MEAIQSLYERVEKVLKGEEIGTVSTGVSDDFNKVAHEFIGYGCFGETIYEALRDKLEDLVGRYISADIVKQDQMWTSCGAVGDLSYVAEELSSILFPSVLEMSHKTKDSILTVDSMYAFIPCTKEDLNAIFERLGDNFKNVYSVNYDIDDIPRDTEMLYKRMLKILPF